MFKKFFAFLMVISFVSCTPKDIDSILGTVLNDGALSNLDIGNGLKEALTNGISKGAQRLSVKDGYMKSAYKILLPEEVTNLTSKLKNVPGFSQVEDKMLTLLNRAAEDAATTAKPIFISAIKGMSFQDAKSILMGDKNAATSYLNKTTNSQLYKAFQPKVVNSLDKVNATDYWTKAVSTYNKIPFVKKLNPSLDDYVTQQALKGLFSMVEKEELNIRSNIRNRSSDLMKKVFALQDKS